MSNSIIEWCRRHIIRTNLIVLGIEVICACLIWFIFGGRQTFGPLNTYVIVCLSVVIASIAALNSMFASVTAHDSFKTTRESLELTRESQRPFLNVSRCAPVWSKNDKVQTTVNYFVIDITNTGIFPADKISVLFNIRDSNSNNQKHWFTPRNRIPSICFPNDVMQNLIFKEADDKNKLTVQQEDKVKVQIELSYENKLTNKPHKTIRSYLAQDVPTDDRIIPLPEEDYWD